MRYFPVIKINLRIDDRSILNLIICYIWDFVKDEDEDTTVALLKDPADEGTPSSVGSNEYMSLVSDTPPPRPQSRREFIDGASLVSG